MGIDAVMFVRYVGDPPTQKQLDNWNKDLDYKIEIRSFGIEKSPISIKNDELWDDCYYNKELIETNDGYTVLDINVSARYFSKSYPRGNILYLCSFFGKRMHQLVYQFTVSKKSQRISFPSTI